MWEETRATLSHCVSFKEEGACWDVLQNTICTHALLQSATHTHTHTHTYHAGSICVVDE